MKYLLLVSCFFALWRSYKSLHFLLAEYFAAQLIYIPLTRITAWYYGDTSTEYLWAYILGTLLIFVPMGRIAIRASRDYGYPARALGIALTLTLVLGRLCVMAVPSMKTYHWVGIVEGCFLFFCGLLVGLPAGKCRRADLIVLSLLWFSLGLFRLGFYWHLSEPWLSLNWQVPGILCVLGFLAVGASVRPLQHPEHHRDYRP